MDLSVVALNCRPSPSSTGKIGRNLKWHQVSYLFCSGIREFALANRDEAFWVPGTICSSRLSSMIQIQVFLWTIRAMIKPLLTSGTSLAT